MSLEQNEWLSQGIEQGWVSAVYCEMHDGHPQEIWEWLEAQDYDDPCIPAVVILFAMDLTRGTGPAERDDHDRAPSTHQEVSPKGNDPIVG